MNDVMIALQYSFDQSTWVTWLAIGLLMYRVFQSITAAYKNHNSFSEMQASGDRMAVINFGLAVLLSMICVFIFFLPYLLEYKG